MLWGKTEDMNRRRDLELEISEVGPTTLEMALDFLRDEDEPIPTGAELEALREECDRNADRMNKLDAELEEVCGRLHYVNEKKPFFLRD